MINKFRESYGRNPELWHYLISVVALFAFVVLFA